MTGIPPQGTAVDLPVTVTALHEMVLDLRQQVTDLSTWVTAVLIANGPPNPAEHTPADSPHGQPPEIDPILTPRQYAVAALVTEGLSNRQIAERLVISKRTVDSHVEHILFKLGFSSRTQVAAWVVQTPPRAPGGLGAEGPAAAQQGCGPLPPQVGPHPA